MVEYDDDDEQRMFRALGALRNYVVTVSSDFASRLAVRLGALAAARDSSDPSVVGLLGSTVVDATNLMVSPFAQDERASSTPGSDGSDERDDTQDSSEPEEPQEPDDG